MHFSFVWSTQMFLARSSLRGIRTLITLFHIRFLLLYIFSRSTASKFKVLCCFDNSVTAQSYYQHMKRKATGDKQSKKATSYNCVATLLIIFTISWKINHMIITRFIRQQPCFVPVILLRLLNGVLLLQIYVHFPLLILMSLQKCMFVRFLFCCKINNTSVAKKKKNQEKGYKNRSEHDTVSFFKS